MPIQNNVQLLNAYDDGINIPVPRIPVADPACEHAAQCLAMEILRGWRAAGLPAYNNDAGYPATSAQVQEAAFQRAALNPASSEQLLNLTDADKQQANSIGENYFEHGYVNILAGTSNTDKRTLQRDGTLT